MPRPPDRCRGSTEEDRCSRAAWFVPIADAASGSAFGCDLDRREDARHGGLGPLPGGARRCAECSVTRVTTGLAVAGMIAGRRRRLAGPPPERARHSRRPECGQLPAFPADAIGLMVLPVSVHDLSSRPARVPLRWRAEDAPLKRRDRCHRGPDRQRLPSAAPRAKQANPVDG